MILICLTGILGSGKSTVTALLKKRGFDVIDLDALARDSLNWKETQNDIKDAFGKEYIVNGKVDVERLRGTAFTKEKDHEGPCRPGYAVPAGLRTEKR